MSKHILTRELIEAGGIDAMVAREAPMLRVLSDCERAASLRATLDAKPDGDAWLFGYGSLIWNPTIHSVEQRLARIRGWHRSFCLSTTAGRGSADNPGLVLGLEEGGDCTGVAFRIPDDILEAELRVLWKREMLSGAYVPRWLEISDERGYRFGSALAFTIDPAGHQYAGALCADEVVRRLATAAGYLGSAADYLFHTCEGLREHGIPDAHLEELAESVTAVRMGACARS